MKLIERSLIGAQSSSVPVLDRIMGIWKFGFAWDRDTQAQKILVEYLGEVLNDSYTLITNVSLPDYSLPIPLVLVGKTGLRTIYVTGEGGIFSLKNSQWYKLDEKKQRYRPSGPHLIRRTALMSRSVIEYLQENGIYLDEQEATLFFAQPGVFIDAPESPVYLLQIDSVDRFAADLVNERITLDALEIQRIIEILTQSKPKAPEKSQPLPSKSSLEKYVGIGEYQMKVWQLLILFVLAIFMLITVILTAVVILSTA